MSRTKIFISCGDHDLSDNIVHCVLARLPGAPVGADRGGVGEHRPAAPTQPGDAVEADHLAAHLDLDRLLAAARGR